MSDRRAPRIVFQDLDGCLNPEDGEDFPPGAVGVLSSGQERMLEAIARAIAASRVEVVAVNSGRGLADTLYIADKLRGPKLRYLLLEHCAFGYDLVGGRRMDLGELASRLGFTAAARGYGELTRVQDLLAWYRREGHRGLERRFGVEMPALDKEANLSVPVPPRAAPEEVLAALRAEILRNFPDCGELHFCFTPRFVDVTAGVHKSTGAEILCRHLGIPLAEAAAIGDSLNDLSIFEFLDHVCCPANSHEKVKTACRGKGGRISGLPFGEACLEFYRSWS